jgi:hypothetical protein
MRLECIIVNALDEAGWGEVAGKYKLLVSGDLKTVKIATPSLVLKNRKVLWRRRWLSA